METRTRQVVRVPMTTRIFERRGIAIETLIDGQGPLVVMLPSLGRPAQDFDDLARRVVAQGFTAARIQPRGIGRSSGPMENQSLFDLAADTAHVIESLGAPALVVGHAYGQRQARALAAAHPEIVRALVLIAAGGKVPITDDAREALFACFDATLPPERHLANVRKAFFAPGNDAAVWRDGWHAATARLQATATQATPIDAWWAGGRAPLLVVQALQDAIAVPENGRALKRAFADRVTLVEINGAGHALLPEQPDQIAAVVLPFLHQHATR
jgi:pimeloyl-ACP methyl ester carboxylesterase